MATGSFRLPLSASSGNTSTFLQLFFDNIDSADLMVGDSSDVSDWNTFFDLPANGNPFTSVQVLGREVILSGGSNITIKELLMVDYNSVLLQIIDSGSIVKIGYDAFLYSNCLTDIYLSGCTEIESDENGQGAFYGCSALYNVTMPLLTTLGDHIFDSCTQLSKITLPLLESAGINCFYACAAVTSFNFPSFTTAGNSCFSGCMYSEFIFPLLATAGDYCFYGCSSAYYIEFPLLTIAGAYCFGDCANTYSFDLPLLVTAGEYCFISCSGLQEYDLTSLETAGNSCFSGCSSVSEFDLPALTSAGTYCFNSCSGADTFDFPLLETIGDYCFSNCSSVTSFNLPSVESLGSTVGDDYVFDSIYSMEIALTIPTALMTCNEGDPDGDISSLVVNNTSVTITQV
ncbi:MAG: leucine-rich repeat domain-containing protein [Bacteroidota bacterium]